MVDMIEKSSGMYRVCQTMTGKKSYKTSEKKCSAIGMTEETVIATSAATESS